jgi:hypothetical protein
LAVLSEALSVVVRLEAIEQSFTGGWNSFVRGVPNRTLCSDGVFVRVGFVTPEDADSYVATLESGGLVHVRDGETVDFAVVDQMTGPTVPSSWLEFGMVGMGGMKIGVCYPPGQIPSEIALPENWTYEGSISQKTIRIPDEKINDRLQFLRHEEGCDVYLNLDNGKALFMRRPKIQNQDALTALLKFMCDEMLDIETRVWAFREAKDEQGALPLFNRLNGEMLPELRKIAEGDGSKMAFAHFALGLNLRILACHEEAERAFRRANDLQPRDLNTLRELVRCLGRQGKHEHALPFAREAVDVAPDDAGSWGNLSTCLIQCKMREEAHRAISRAIQLDPDDKINWRIYENFDRFF